jgi:hypothetical protein
VLPVLFRRKLRLIITMDGITDIITEGITTGITITTITIGTGVGLSASMGVQGITAIGNRITVRTAGKIADLAKQEKTRFSDSTDRDAFPAERPPVTFESPCAWRDADGTARLAVKSDPSTSPADASA